MVTKTTDGKRAELLKKKQQIEARLKALDARETATRKAADTRRKILVGAAVLEGIKRNADIKQWLAGELDKFLERPRDREVLEDLLPATTVPEETPA